MNVQALVRRAGLEMVRGVQGQFHERPSREPVATLPGVGRVRTLVLAPAQTVMLQIIHELEQVNRNGRLAEVGHQVGPTKHAKTDEEGRALLRAMKFLFRESGSQAASA